MNPALPQGTLRHASPQSTARSVTFSVTRWSGAGQRGAALLGVMITGKLVVLGLRMLDGTSGKLGLLTLPVLLAADLLTGGLWTLLDVLLGRLLRFPESVRWLLYGAVAIYVASNVPVMRMFGTPLTFAILNAADVALADSLAVYVTASNVVGIGMVLLAALGLPLLTARRPRTQRTGTSLFLGTVTLATIAVGFAARSHVELRGLSRNVLISILHTTLLQRDSQGAATDIEVLSLPPLTPESGLPPARELSSLGAAARDRSVLWIVLESTAARYLRPYGAEVDPMPQLTALAARSFQFDSIYAAYPESIKGLFSTLCSMNPAAHTTAARYTQARLPCPSIGLRFQDAGYRTAMFHSGWFLYLGMSGVIADRGFSVAKDAGIIRSAYTTSFGVDEVSTVHSVLSFFDDSLTKGERAFVMYLPITGHHPYHSPGPRDRAQPFPVQSDLDAYRNDLFLGDEALGQLMAGLETRGLLSKILLVVSADHGEAFQQHPGNFGHTLHLYDENLRVPLWIHLPGVTDQERDGLRRKFDQPGSILDIAPTLLDLVGLPIPESYQGQSLLRPRSPDAAPRFLTDHAIEQVGLRQGPWKFIDEPESGRSLLFDLRSDPAEQHNLAALHPERVTQYRAHLRTFYNRQRLLITAH